MSTAPSHCFHTPNDTHTKRIIEKKIYDRMAAIFNCACCGRFVFHLFRFALFMHSRLSHTNARHRQTAICVYCVELPDNYHRAIKTKCARMEKRGRCICRKVCRQRRERPRPQNLFLSTEQQFNFRNALFLQHRNYYF